MERYTPHHITGGLLRSMQQTVHVFGSTAADAMKAIVAQTRNLLSKPYPPPKAGDRGADAHGRNISFCFVPV